MVECVVKNWQGEEVGQGAEGQARRIAAVAASAPRDPARHQGSARVPGQRARRPLP